MEKYRKENLTNIKSLIQKKTDVSFNGKYHTNVVRRNIILAASAMCFISLSAFGYYKFSSLSGDNLSLSSVYLGDGKYEIFVTNLSRHELKLQNKTKLMEWATGNEVEGKAGKIIVEASKIPAGETGIIHIDISEAYNVSDLQNALSDNNWYYFVLTNNDFMFGQDWMCSIDFSVDDIADVIESHNDFVEYITEDEPYIPEYKNEILIYSEWALPTDNLLISSYFGIQNHGIYSDHINIAGSEGDNIYAVADGVVIDIGYVSTYGNYVVLSVDGRTSVTYGHLKEVFVSEGDSVTRNTVIGSMGKTGMATGPNLSFAVCVDGEYINPLK